MQPTSSAARPGSGSPSRNSSEAPPPVEMCVMSPARPERMTAATESPPPTTLMAPLSATAAAIAIVPAANGGTSNMPIGPFQKTVRAVAIAARKRSTVSGPMSSPILPAGISRTVVGRRAGARLVGHDVVDRQHADRPAVPRAAAQQLAGQADLVLLDERPAGRLPCGAQERVRHRAADQQRVHALEQAADDLDLVRDLGAAEDRDERPLRRRRAPCRGTRPRAAAGTRRRARGRSGTMPTVEAWARCAVPKASLT